MSSFVPPDAPLPWVDNEAADRRGETFSALAGASADKQAAITRARIKQLETLAIASGDGPDGEARWRASAAALRIKDPKAELQILRNQLAQYTAASMPPKPAPAPDTDPRVTRSAPTSQPPPAKNEGSFLDQYLFKPLGKLSAAGQGIAGAPSAHYQQALKDGTADSLTPLDFASDAWKGIKTGLQQGENSPYTIGNSLRAEDKGYTQAHTPEEQWAALDQAKKENDAEFAKSGRRTLNPKQDTETRAREILRPKDLPLGENTLLNHPDATEFVGSLFTPDQALLGGAGKLMKAAKNSAVAEKIGFTIGDMGGIGRKFNADYNINKLGEAAAQVAPSGANAAYDVNARAQSVLDKVKEYETLAPKDKGDAIGYALDTGDTRAIANDPQAMAAFQKGREITNDWFAVKKDFNKGKTWSQPQPLVGANGQVIQPPSRLKEQGFNENYAPGRSTDAQAAGQAQYDQTLGLSGKNYRSGLSGSDFRRRVDEGAGDVTKLPENYDFAQSMRQQIASQAPALKFTGTISNMANATAGKFWSLEPAATVGGDLAEEMTKASGVPHINVDKYNPDLAENIKAIITKPGTRADASLIMAKPLAEEMEAMARLNIPMGDKAQAFVDAMNAANRAFSTAVTVPFGGYHERNIVGNMVLGATAMGVDSIGYGAKAPIAMAAGANWAPKALKNLSGAGGLTMAETVEAAKRYGVISPNALTKTDILGSTAAQKVIQGATAPLRGLTAVANKSDDALRLSLFMHELDKFPKADPAAIAVATQKTNEWILNYSKLGTLEQKVISKVIPFYAWQRTTVRLAAKALTEKPDAIAVAAKAFTAMAHSQDANAPYSGSQLPPYLANRPAFAAPEHFQTPAQQRRLEAIMNGYKPGTDVQTYVTATPELGVISFLVPPAAQASGGDARKFQSFMFPAAGVLADTILGNLKASQAPQALAKDYTKRFENFHKLYLLATGDPLMQADLASRFAVANNMGYVVSKAINALYGQELLPTLAPDVPLYKTDAKSNQNYAKSRAFDESKADAKVDRSNELFPE